MHTPFFSQQAPGENKTTHRLLPWSIPLSCLPGSKAASKFTAFSSDDDSTINDDGGIQEKPVKELEAKAPQQVRKVAQPEEVDHSLSTTLPRSNQRSSSSFLRNGEMDVDCLSATLPRSNQKPRRSRRVSPKEEHEQLYNTLTRHHESNLSAHGTAVAYGIVRESSVKLMPDLYSAVADGEYDDDEDGQTSSFCDTWNRVPLKQVSEKDLMKRLRCPRTSKHVVIAKPKGKRGRRSSGGGGANSTTASSHTPSTTTDTSSAGPRLSGPILCDSLIPPNYKEETLQKQAIASSVPKQGPFLLPPAKKEDRRPPRPPPSVLIAKQQKRSLLRAAARAVEETSSVDDLMTLTPIKDEGDIADETLSVDLTSNNVPLLPEITKAQVDPEEKVLPISSLRQRYLTPKGVGSNNAANNDRVGASVGRAKYQPLAGSASGEEVEPEDRVAALHIRFLRIRDQLSQAIAAEQQSSGQPSSEGTFAEAILRPLVPKDGVSRTPNESAIGDGGSPPATETKKEVKSTDSGSPPNEEGAKV